MIQSLLRAMEILEVLKGNEGSFSIAKISEAINLPPSTVHRLLQTLCSKRFVVKDEKSHDYQLGPSLIPLGLLASKNLHLQNSAHSILKKLSAETNEDAFLIIPAGDKGLVLERIDGPSTLKIVEEFGYELYMHCGAIRKVLLAYQSDDFIKDYIKNIVNSDKSFPKTTEKSLLDSLATIRKEGIAVSKGDYIENTIGIGAPIFNSSGKIIASIGIVSPSSRIKDDPNLKQLKETVKHYAKELSSDMGYFMS